MNKNKFMTLIILSIFSLPSMAVTYQGELSQSGISHNGTADLEFKLFDAAANGNQVGVVDLHSAVNVLNGRFVVELEQWSGEFDGSDYWLEIAAAIPAGSGSFTTLNPRQKLGPVPYAEYAYDLDITGLQLRVDETCGINTAIQVIDQNGSVSCGTFAAEDHGHEFSDLTSVPAGLDDGDDDTTYDGGDFALSNQGCAIGQMVTGISAAGIVQCENPLNVSLPPDCDQNNQALQYNSESGWSCVNLTQIGGSSGQAHGFEMTDSWGDTWDGLDRVAMSWNDANQACEDKGGRLPTISELYRVSGAFKSEVGSANDSNFLWSRTWWSKTNKGSVRLTDGAVSAAITTFLNSYRCIWPAQDLSYFVGDQCMGEPGDACWNHVGYPNNTVSMDKMERPAVTYVAATDECAFVHAHLADQQDYAENIINGLPGGTNNWQWTSNHVLDNLVFIVRWQDVDLNYTDYDDPYVFYANRAVGLHKFRCAGVNYPAGAHPATVPNEFVADTTYIKTTDAATNNALYGDSIDGCFSQGGHMAHSRDIMELVRAGMSSGPSPAYVWLSDHSRYDYTQVARWNGTDTSFTSHHDEYVDWRRINLINENQHRCVFYPIDARYKHPSDASCAAGLSCQTFENGASKLAVDSFDRPAASYLAATQVCLDNGGQLATTFQITESIRAGLPNGSNTAIWTSDSGGNNSNGNSYSIVLNWSATEPTYSPIYPTSATWLDKLPTTTSPYRCVWSNELR